MNFFDSFICTSGVHCKTCRDTGIAGNKFRKRHSENHKIGIIDFECPESRGSKIWGFVPERGQVLPQLPSRPVRFLDWSPKIKRIADRAIQGDAGVGDTLKRRYAKYGGEIYKKLRKSLGSPCNCEKNQSQFNALYPYDGKEGRPSFPLHDSSIVTVDK